MRSLAGLAAGVGVVAAVVAVDTAVLPGEASAPTGLLVLVLALLTAAVAALHRSRARLGQVLRVQRAENLRFDTAVNHISQGLCFFDGQRRLIVSNHRYADMYCLPRAQLRPGITLEAVVDLRYAAGTAPDMAPADYLKWRAAIAVSDTASDTVALLKDGRTFAIHHEPMPDGGWVATHEDITELLRAQAQVERLAKHDALTGLPNRVLFRERLNEAVGRGRVAAVLCLDLDRFKAVNDTLGHPVGDRLLVAAGERLSRCVREGDLVARLGGDEFAIVQADAGQPAAALALAERLVRVIAEPFEIGGHRIVVGTSVGVALLPADAADPDELLKRADLALYEAKARGRGGYHFFRPELGEKARVRSVLEADLRSALGQGELELVYQPVVHLHDHKVRAFEALLRWHHPQRGLLMPADFVGLAEDTGLIEEVGAWVLQQAFAEATHWPAHVGVSVNLSPMQMKRGDLVRVVKAALQASGLAPTRVELEITEAVPLAQNSSNLAMLHELRTLGVCIALDDFGVGHSSLGYLRTFPFARIKIDRSLVRDVTGNRETMAIVRAVVTLGSSLGMQVTAEGVETAAQAHAVRELGCGEAQGYFFSTPRPAADVDAVLKLERRFVVVPQEAARAAR